MTASYSCTQPPMGQTIIDIASKENDVDIGGETELI